MLPRRGSWHVIRRETAFGISLLLFAAAPATASEGLCSLPRVVPLYRLAPVLLRAGVQVRGAVSDGCLRHPYRFIVERHVGYASHPCRKSQPVGACSAL